MPRKGFNLRRGNPAKGIILIKYDSQSAYKIPHEIYKDCSGIKENLENFLNIFQRKQQTLETTVFLLNEFIEPNSSIRDSVFLIAKTISAQR